jgi:nucleoside 2-deoxyribosyltransferase
MEEVKPFCFVIMPFTPALHYFYLYLKNHIEQVHNIVCERGDEQVLVVPILEKINEYVKKADVVIADCTGRNPNVFYELGIAHAHEKKVILITSEDVRDAPTDIRHFEFIRYDLGNHLNFLDRLDNALRNVFETRYVKFYEHAEKIFKKFKQETRAQVSMASKEDFIKRLSAAEQSQGGLPSINDDLAVASLVLPKIIADSSDIAVMTKITSWLGKMSSKQQPRKAASKT